MYELISAFATQKVQLQFLKANFSLNIILKEAKNFTDCYVLQAILMFVVNSCLA